MHRSRIGHAISIDISEFFRQPDLLRQNHAKGRMRLQYRPEFLRKFPLRPTRSATRANADNSWWLANRRNHHREHRRALFPHAGWGRSWARRAALWAVAGRSSTL